jgi:hypothetical protein
MRKLLFRMSVRPTRSDLIKVDLVTVKVFLFDRVLCVALR